MSGFRQPQFLTRQDEPKHRIRCPIHGFIHFSDHERRIIDHWLFRRLRFIRQLALTDFLYPGATHTRFEHSLGVLEVATRAFDGLAAKRGDLVEKVFRTVAGFEDKPMALARQVLRLAALLHDVGHFPFSHAAEAVILGGRSHESLSIEIIREREWLGGMINSLFGEGIAGFVAQLIEGGHNMPPQLQILRNLVSGEMDADRTDYLLRDSLHCGVDYGRFDYRRMIETLEVEEGEAGELRIALHDGGIHTFEALIIARYHMNTQVYQHRLRRIYDLYLNKYHESLGEEKLSTSESVLNNNDITMISKIIWDADHSSGDRQKWARRLRDRNHHRVVHQTGVNADADGLRFSRQVLTALQQRYDTIEFLSDLATGRVHKLFIPGMPDDIDRVRLTLIGGGTTFQHVGAESQILRYIPAQFQCARIFADVTPEQEGLRQEIRSWAAEEYQRRGGH